MNDYFELFLSLISSFLSGSTDPAAFKAEYMKLWLRDARDWDERQFTKEVATIARDVRR
jgi:hypothetical protein